MNLFEAIILGIIQGLTEFLPVSSSGHILLGEAVLGTHTEESLAFTVVVHFATVLSTIIVFRRFIIDTLKGLLQPDGREHRLFAGHILLSMLPVLVVGLFFKDAVEALFEGSLAWVGAALLFTGLLLLLTLRAPRTTGPVTGLKALLVGIAQAVAVTPGISRSGATIATGLLLGIDKSLMARFSFLMVIPPIIGAMLLDGKDMWEAHQAGTLAIDPLVLLGGFVAAFITGLLACRLMIRIVQKGQLQYFAYYCFLVGLLAIGYTLLA